jgi:hypothetical protein
MMSGWVLFGEIITQVVGALAPVDKKLILTGLILYPIETHVHGFGFALGNCAVGYPGGARVVCLDWRWQLRMAHFDEGSSKRTALAGIVEQASKFGFCRGGHDILRILLTVCISPLFGGSSLEGLLGSVGLELKKKWPPRPLQAFASKRYKASLWMYNTMSLAL